MSDHNEKMECPVCGHSSDLVDLNQVSTIIMGEMFPFFMHEIRHSLQAIHAESNSIFRLLFEDKLKAKRHHERIKSLHRDFRQNFEEIRTLENIFSILYRTNEKQLEIKTIFEFIDRIIALFYARYNKVKLNKRSFSGDYNKSITSKYPLIFYLAMGMVPIIGSPRHQPAKIDINVVDGKLITLIKSYSLPEKITSKTKYHLFKLLLNSVGGEHVYKEINLKMHFEWSVPIFENN